MNDALELNGLDAVRALSDRVPPFDEDAAEEARARQARLTKPPGSLGRLEELAAFMAGWQHRALPRIAHAHALVFAGNHGVCAQGVNPYPQEVTAQMVANFRAGGAAINQLAEASGAELSVVALDLDRPTADFTQAPAMTEVECLEAMRTGAAAVDAKADILVLGEMGIGNSTVAAALACCVFGGGAGMWVGPGTGAEGAALDRKRAVVEAAAERHGAARGMQILAAVGGREQAAICGAVLAARMRSVPVLLDGYICTAAVAPIWATDPALLSHCLAGHLSPEPGHAALLSRMGLAPILDLGMRLGEGTGAALAFGIVRAALACHDGMATFDEAGVASG